MRILLICFLFISQISLGQDGFGKIKGHLNYRNDEPAQHFLVELKDEQQQIVKQTYTYDDGTFYFDSIIPSFYSVVVPKQMKYLNENTQIETIEVSENIQITEHLTEFVDITVHEARTIVIVNVCNMVILKQRVRTWYRTDFPYPYEIFIGHGITGHIQREDIIQRP